MDISDSTSDWMHYLLSYGFSSCCQKIIISVFKSLKSILVEPIIIKENSENGLPCLVLQRPEPIFQRQIFCLLWRSSQCWQSVTSIPLLAKNLPFSGGNWAMSQFLLFLKLSRDPLESLFLLWLRSSFSPFPKNSLQDFNLLSDHCPVPCHICGSPSFWAEEFQMLIFFMDRMTVFEWQSIKKTN